MAYGTINADQIQSSVTGVSLGAGNATGMKNRIINGAMVIDQRNAGASITPTNLQYTVDRWGANLSQASKLTAQQNAGSVTPPAGFSKYLGITSSSAYSVLAGDYFGIYQLIEGFNFADMAWGTANAKTITLSAWVYSSLTGTFGGALNNSGQSRSYPFTYSIPVANTWTQISVTIPGDTSGTWVGATNGAGVQVQFNLGTGTTYSGTAGAWAAGTYVSATGATSVVGTSGATFYITGVQLEVGSSATGFEYRDYGRELILCQRYYEMSYNTGTVPSTITRNGGFFSNTVGGALNRLPFSFKVVKRTAPTVTLYASESGASANVTQWTSGGSTGNVGATAYDVADEGVARVEFTTSSLNVFASWQFTASAEL